MADGIVDIIHKLTYEAVTAPIDKAISTIQKEIDTIDKQAASIQRLETLRASTDKNNLQRINQINAAIDNRRKRVEQETTAITKAIQQNDNLAKSLARQGVAMVQAGDRLDKFGKSANSANLALINIGRVAQDLPFGILGIANNLNPLLESFQRLRQESGSNVTALKALGSSLIGSGGLGLALSVVSSLLIVFGDKLFNTSNETDKAAEKQKKYTQEIENLNKALVDSVKLQSDLNKARSDSQNSGSAQAQRDVDAAKARGAAEEEIFVKEQEARRQEFLDVQRRIGLFEKVRSEIEELANTQLSSDDINRGATLESIVRSGSFNILTQTLGLSEQQATEQAANIASSFRNRTAIFNLFKKEEAELNEQSKDLLSDIENAETTFNRELGKRSIERQREYELLNNETLQIIDSQIATEREILRLRQESRLNQGVSVTQEQLEAETKEADFQISRLEAIRKITILTIEIAAEKKKIAEAERQGNEADAVRFRLAADALDRERDSIRIPQQFTDSINPSFLSGFNRQDLINNRRGGTQSDPRSNAERIKRPDSELKIQTDQFKKEEDAYKKHLKEVVKVYESFEDSISKILNDISKRQIEALDREVDVRTERVRQAEKLAERGNTEVLRLETERLEAAEKLRRDAAQRQIATNAALALSNAIVAVATTAAESGVASIATIPAVLAALVAGYSFVRSLDNNTGFKDGVIDLQGPGTERSDSIPARLSKGESVMTAEATKRYKPLLEAMNEGRLPYTAERGSLGSGDKRMYKKIDQLIEATEGNKVNVTQSLNEHGFVQSVETMRRREARRWRS